MPGKHKMATFSCSYCSREFITRITNKPRFCSHSCASSNRRGKLKVSPEHREQVQKLATKRWRENNKERHKLSTLLWRKRNPEKVKKMSKRRYLKHKLKILEKVKIYSKTLKGLEIKRIKEAKRRAAKLNATPAWASTEKIKEIYKNCPKGFEVDHVVPLKGKNVCGLHVEYNLQYLSKSENCKKSNKLLLGTQVGPKQQEKKV